VSTASCKCGWLGEGYLLARHVATHSAALRAELDAAAVLAEIERDRAAEELEAHLLDGGEPPSL
jgi:hypothetical protein